MTITDEVTINKALDRCTAELIALYSGDYDEDIEDRIIDEIDHLIHKLVLLIEG